MGKKKKTTDEKPMSRSQARDLIILGTLETGVALNTPLYTLYLLNRPAVKNMSYRTYYRRMLYYAGKGIIRVKKVNAGGGVSTIILSVHTVRLLSEMRRLGVIS